jgi:hypothetical protein
MQTTNKKALVLLTISLLTIITFIPFSSATTGKQVGGIINTDTEWTKAEGPYSLVSPVIVGYGVTLHVEEVAVINLNGYNLQVNGILNARGRSGDKISFTSSSGCAIIFSGSSTSYYEPGQTGCIIENSQLNGVYVFVSSGAPKICGNTMIAPDVDSVRMAVEVDSAGAPIIVGNTINGSIECLNGAHPTIMGNTINGGVRAQGFDLSAPVIINNTLYGGVGEPGYSNGIRACGNNFYISNNTIHGCFSAICLNGGTNTVEGNLIYNNTNGIVISQDRYATASIRHNTIYNNTQGIIIDSETDLHKVSIMYNNLVGNGGYKLQGANVTYNWWGTIDQAAIGNMLSSLTAYLPILTSPDQTAPAAQSSSGQTDLPTDTQTLTTSPSTAAYTASNQDQTGKPTATATADTATEKPALTPYQASEAIPEFTLFIAAGFIALSLFTVTAVYYRRIKGQFRKPPVV